MTESQSTERARALLEEASLYARPDFVLEDDVDLLAEGIVDSMGVMGLIEFLERKFGVKVEDDDITEENLGTLAALEL